MCRGISLVGICGPAGVSGGACRAGITRARPPSPRGRGCCRADCQPRGVAPLASRNARTCSASSCILSVCWSMYSERSAAAAAAACTVRTAHRQLPLPLALKSPCSQHSVCCAQDAPSTLHAVKRAYRDISLAIRACARIRLLSSSRPWLKF